MKIKKKTSSEFEQKIEILRPISNFAYIDKNSLEHTV